VREYMNPILLPADQIFWSLKKIGESRKLHSSIQANVVVIGGGMAGLAAAQSFQEKGLSVVLLEKYHCGSGASGKSSGFITPDSELDLNYFKKVFGCDNAKKLWEFAIDGVAFIERNIKRHHLVCDYQVQDTLVVANSRHAFGELEQEYQTRQELNYPSTLYNQETLVSALGGDHYFGGIRYGGTFGINAYLYCQLMKEVLLQQGIQVYEDSPVLSIDGHTVSTNHGQVTADYIVVCADRFIPDLGKLTQEIYHAQTFLMMSESLNDKDIATIFPDQPLMVWDTDLIYTYFRLMGDGRMLLGGANIINTYERNPRHNATSMAKKLTSYFKYKFPQVSVNFDYMWPGLIGISKDIMPIAGRDIEQPYIYYVSAATGLHWAAALGKYSAEHMIDGRRDLDEFFSPQRSFPLGGLAQKLLGTPITFALANGMSMFFPRKKV